MITKTLTLAIVRNSDREVQFIIGARSVSWYPPTGSNPDMGAASLFAVDVGRAVASTTIEDALTMLWPAMPPCETVEVAAMEVNRMRELLLDCEDGDRLLELALAYAATVLREGAVRW